jgi:hypothetical protein
MTHRDIGIVLLMSIMLLAGNTNAQNIYELRKLTEQDWLSMSTEDRLNAIGMANKEAKDQTLLGSFGTNYELYKRWGYEFYEMNDRYENYTFRGYENYNIMAERRLRWSYNEFGDRIVRMRGDANIWHETYSGDGTFYVETPNRFINSMASNDIDGVWVAQESTNDWAFTAIGARALRTKFTPLTLSLPNMNGMRLDFQSANTNAAVISSSLLGTWWSWHSRTDPNFRSPSFERYAGEDAKNTYLVTNGGVLLRGGYIQRKFGALTVGASYVNEYGVQGNREGGDSWFGTASNYSPIPLVVGIRFMDDSPNDNEGGPIVYDVKIKIDGKYHPDIIPVVMLDDMILDRTTALKKSYERDYLAPPASAMIGGPIYDFLGIEGSIPKYADYFYMRDSITGANPKNVRDGINLELVNKYLTFVDPGGGPIQASGTKCIVYFFDLTSIKEHVNRVEAEITVANDYNIQTALIYTKESPGGHDTSGKIKTYYDATYWKTMAQAEGNVKDKSNATTLTLDFGVQVASIIYGLDFNFNYHGFKVTGEFVNNSSHYMYPDEVPGAGFPTAIVSGLPPRTGHKFSQNDRAYYFIAQKDWERLGLAAELFKMGKFYRPYMDYYFVFPHDYAVSAINTRNSTVRMPLVEDNDDNDQYPDTMIEQNAMGYNIITSEDPDGVFPGNDADNDGIPDNNKNNNDIPDYEEPFLMFDSDRDEFIFGNDYNNNNIPDFREDDMKLDTPYELDRQGHHIMLRYTPFRSVNLIAGSFRTGGVGRDNRTNDDYFKLLVNYDVFTIGRLYAEYRYERIQDDIRDQYMQVTTKMKGNYLEPGIICSTERFTRELFYDELEYKNSRVNRLWLDSVIRAVPSIILENHVKYEKNDQVEGVMYDNTYQPSETINTLAMVNKIVYNKRFGNWIFSPGIKFGFYKKDRHDIARPGDYYVTRIPLIMLKYMISDRSDLMFGLQGIPGFEFDFKDHVQSENDCTQKTYCLQLQNRSVYFGYNVWASTGIKYDEREYSEITRAFENYKSSTIFVNVNLGW